MSDESDVTFSTGATTPDVPGPRPYTLVFVGDLRAQDRLDALTSVDKESFADVLSRARPTLAIALKPPGGAGPDWEFVLTFDTLKAFEPVGLLRQIPAAAARLAIWEKIQQRRLGKLSEQELESAIDVAVGGDASLAWLRSAEADVGGTAPGGATPAAGSSILDLVDEPDESRRIAADVERLAAGAGDREARIGAPEGGRLEVRLQRLQLELTTIAGAVLQHPDVHGLEAAWRGLKFLVDRIDFREGVRLALLHSPREELVDRFVRHLVDPVFDGDADSPGMVLLDFAFQNKPVDHALLDELGQHAAGLPVPLVFSLEPAFFDVRTANLIKNLPNLVGLVDGWQFAKWRSLREQPYSRWLVAVLGRFILRAPHAARSGAHEFTCEEKLTAASQALWAGGHLAMGVCAARAQAAHGWPTRMYGVEAGKVADLPVVQNPADAQKPWGPGDATLPDRRVDELPAIGINLLQSIPGKDYCVLLGGVSVARPAPTADVSAQQATLEVSVPYQQFSNITGAWLCDQLPGLRGQTAEDIQKRLLVGLRDLLQLTEEDSTESVMVGVGAAEDDPTRTRVHVRVTPPARIVPGGLHVDFGFELPS